MTTIIVDDISILRRPAFLAVSDARFRVLVTRDALRSAHRLAREMRIDRGIIALMERAEAEGTIQVREIVATEDSGDAASAPQVVPTSDLRPLEADLLRLALQEKRQRPSEEMWLSLQFDAACRVARVLGLRASQPSLIVFAIREAVTHAELGPVARQVRRDNLLHRVVGLFCMLLLLACGLGLLFLLGQPLSGNRIALIAAAVPPIAVVLYWFRVHHRLQYGLTEILFGCILAVTALVRAGPSFAFSTLLQLLAALYVVVRGLDNISYGVRWTGWASAWDHVFGPREG